MNTATALRPATNYLLPPELRALCRLREWLRPSHYYVGTLGRDFGLLFSGAGTMLALRFSRRHNGSRAVTVPSTAQTNILLWCRPHKWRLLGVAPGAVSFDIFFTLNAYCLP